MTRSLLIIILCLVLFRLTGNTQVYHGRHTVVELNIDSARQYLPMKLKDTTALMLWSPSRNTLIAQVDMRSFQFPWFQFAFDRMMSIDSVGRDSTGSTVYPCRYAKFTGTLSDTIDPSRDGVYNIMLSGNLTVHGVTRPRIIPASVVVKNGVAVVDAAFTIVCYDFGIVVDPVFFTQEVRIRIHTEMYPPSPK